MSFKEQLRDEILPKTVEYYNGGLDINSAIVKAASDFKLNVDQTDRLVETMNTARVIAHYEKNAEDRTANCDIADKSEVRRMLFEDRTEKKASAGEPAYDYWSYGVAERDYRRPSSMTKAAEDSPRAKSTDGYSRRQIVERVVKYASELEDRRRFAEDRLGMAQSLIASRLSKIARSLSSGYEPEERYALFKAACIKFPSAAREIEKLVPPHIVKGASSFARKYRRANVVDDSPVRDAVKSAGQIERDIENAGKLEKIAGVVARKEAEVKGLVSKYAELEKGAAIFGNPPPRPSGGGSSGGRGGKGGRGGHGGGHSTRLGSAVRAVGKGIGFARKGVGWVHDRVTPTLPGERALYEYVAQGVLNQDNIDKAINPEPKKTTSLKEYVDNIRRSAIINELAANDEILKDADRTAIANAYQLLVQTAPETSLNKEIVRSILRQSVNSIAVSPFDVKQWADLDNVLLKNRELA